LHLKVDRGGDEESTSRSMTRRQQRYANEGDLVLMGYIRMVLNLTVNEMSNRMSDTESLVFVVSD
jgi:hypothetical protein